MIAMVPEPEMTPWPPPTLTGFPALLVTVLIGMTAAVHPTCWQLAVPEKTV